MLNIEKKVVIDSNYIDKEIYIKENVISEGLISFIDIKEDNTCKMGFKDALGNIVIPAIYTDVSSFENGLAWVYNDYFVPILINKNAEELLYSKCDLYSYKELAKIKNKYLNEHKTFAKKNVFRSNYKYKIYEKNGLYGLKDENNKIIIPANYENFIYKDDILIIDNILYNLDTLNIKYILKLYDSDYSIKKEFLSYENMEEYITLFKKEYDSKVHIINEDILKQIFELEKKKKQSVKNVFIDADKKYNKLLKK